MEILDAVGSSAAPQPTELRGTGVFFSFFWAGGEGGTSLDGGKSFSWSLIITVITFWTWGVPGGMRDCQGQTNGSLSPLAFPAWSFWCLKNGDGAENKEQDDEAK